MVLQRSLHVSAILFVISLAVYDATGQTFSELQRNYPKGDAYTLKEQMGLPDWLYQNGPPNTCAIRMSKAFIDAGYTINRSIVRNCDTQSANLQCKGVQCIIRARYFRCYLKALWGSPQRISSSAAVQNKKGVILFTDCRGLGGGFQHIDLWDDYSCSLGCNYFDKCSTIEFYSR